MGLLSGVFNGPAFSGVLSGGIDPSHYPFKRSRVRPGGPIGVRSEETQKWECRWKKPYVQVCTNTKTGTKKTVKVKRKYKKKYNKAYRSGKYPKGPQFKRKTARPGAQYRKPSPAWLKSKRAPRRGRKS